MFICQPPFKDKKDTFPTSASTSNKKLMADQWLWNMKYVFLLLVTLDVREPERTVLQHWTFKLCLNGQLWHSVRYSIQITKSFVTHVCYEREFMNPGSSEIHIPDTRSWRDNTRLQELAISYGIFNRDSKYGGCIQGSTSNQVSPPFMKQYSMV